MAKQKIIFRILASFVLLVSIFLLPFYITTILGLAGMIYFSYFWEATIIFLLSDLIYGTKEAEHSLPLFISFIVSVLVLIFIEIFKKKIKFYPRA